MAKNLTVGEEVYVPCSLFEQTSCSSALYKTNVLTVNDRSVTVRLPGGHPSDPVASSKVQRSCAIWIITIGDLETEYTLLSPLSKSVLQFCRLLHSDDDLVLHTRIGSIGELSKIWARRNNAFEFIIMIGHGSNTGFFFANDEWVDSTRLLNILDVDGAHPKTFLSLCCETGKCPFAKTLSLSRICKTYIAPFHSIHGAIASQFVQTFLSQLLLEGRTKKTAFNYARKSVPGSSKFRYWENGNLKSPK